MRKNAGLLGGRKKENKMKEILSRKGNKVKAGKVNVRIPRDRLALTLLSDNKLENGDVVEPPWIYHANGSKSPLMRIVYGKSCREDRFFDVQKAEQTLWRIDTQIEKVKKEWQELFQKIAKVKYALAKEFDGTWIKYRVEKIAGEYGLRTQLDVSLKKGGVRNQEIGQAFYRADYRWRRLGRIRGIALEAFIVASRNDCPELYNQPDTTRIIRFNINGRNYLFSQLFEGSGYRKVDLLSTNQNAYVEVNY